MSLYNDSQWIEFFRMDKDSVARLCYSLRAAVEKQNTKHRLAIPVAICTICRRVQIFFRVVQNLQLDIPLSTW
jgi:hypothetical protein